MTKDSHWIFTAMLALACGCGSSESLGIDGDGTEPGGSKDPGKNPGGTGTADGGTGTTNTPTGDPGGTTGAPATACGTTNKVCTAWNEISTCADAGGSTSWTKAKCPAGQGCVLGACMANSCSDDCQLGESGCSLADASGATKGIDTGKMHDRARAFEKWIHTDTDSFFYDQIVSVKYNSDARARGDVNSAYIGDSAMHTGIYLAAEAYELQSTGSFRARKSVRNAVDLFHRLFNVSGDPGMLATTIFPTGKGDVKDWTGWKCTDFDRNCNVAYDGKQWDYVGDPSRDMYMGPLIGLVPAYDALGTFDEDRREIIRQDLVTWAKELIKKRTVPVRLVLNGLALPVTNHEVRFFIPETADMVDGAVQVSASTSDVSGGDIRGGQEFMPNPSLLFRQFPIPLLSSLPDIPRSSSAMMVPGIIQAALHVTEGVAKYATDRKALSDFYYSNNDEWGNVSTWTAFASSYGSQNHDCSGPYFGTHIAFIGAHAWGKLETNPSVKADVFSKVIDGKLWADVADHKNAFFSFGYGDMKPGGLTGAPLAEALKVVEDFPAPPRIRVNKSGSCTSTAAEIGDRPVTYLSWQASPWNREDSVNGARQTYPGHDYLVAYWMARAEGAIVEDTPTRCAHK